MAYLIKLARSHDDLHDLRILAHRIDEQSAHQHGRISFASDQAQGGYFSVYHQDEAVGYVRVSLEITSEIPIPDSFDKASFATTPMARLSQLACLRGHEYLATPLMREAIRYLKTYEIKDFIMMAHRQDEIFLRRFGLMPLFKFCHHDQPFVVMKGNTFVCGEQVFIDPVKYHHVGRLVLLNREVLFEPGTKGGTVYLVVHGELSIEKTEDTTGQVYRDFADPGRIVGAGELMPHQARNYRALANEYCELLVIPADMLLDYLDHYSIHASVFSHRIKHFEKTTQYLLEKRAQLEYKDSHSRAHS